jgi:hypothetical protein
MLHLHIPRPSPAAHTHMTPGGGTITHRALLAVDDLLTDLAVHLVAATGRARHVSPQYLALAVPGLCHTHNPCLRETQPGCAYCARRGNCFAR